MVGDEKHTVSEVDYSAFDTRNRGHGLVNIYFHETLIKIGDSAFYGNHNLMEIVLPESIKTVMRDAFNNCGEDCESFVQIYLPKGLRSLSFAFENVGTNVSPNEYYQGNLTCIPNFITLGNCLNFGLDEEALELYYERLKQNEMRKNRRVPLA